MHLEWDSQQFYLDETNHKYRGRHRIGSQFNKSSFGLHCGLEPLDSRHDAGTNLFLHDQLPWKQQPSLESPQICWQL